MEVSQFLVENTTNASLDTWSVVWYIASFGGLIVFFLIVSCSEWCCRRNARRNFSRTSNVQSAIPIVPDTPPPSYDQFAPPDYESICYKMPGTSRNEKSEFDIYVVPVHTFGTIMEDARRGEGGTYTSDDSPPSYQSAFENLQGNVPVSQTTLIRSSRKSSNILDPRNLSSGEQSGTSDSNVYSVTPAVMPNIQSDSHNIQISVPNTQSSNENVPSTYQNTAT